MTANQKDFLAERLAIACADAGIPVDQPIPARILIEQEAIVLDLKYQHLIGDETNL